MSDDINRLERHIGIVIERFGYFTVKTEDEDEAARRIAELERRSYVYVPPLFGHDGYVRRRREGER